jgi:metal-responsive CopG/Arc/MetJ family transcriptional regulator
MTSDANAQAVENIIGYKFRNSRNDLIKALTAAGAQEDDWDGNRKLAQFGTALCEFLLSYLAFEAGVPRGMAQSTSN